MLHIGPQGIGRLAGIAAVLLAVGCASSSTQTITISTSTLWSTCVLEQAGKLIAVVGPTPESIEVPRQDQFIYVECNKPGYELSRASLFSSSPWASLPSVRARDPLGLGRTGPNYPSAVELKMSLLAEESAAESDKGLESLPPPRSYYGRIEDLSANGIRLPLTPFSLSTFDLSRERRVFILGSGTEQTGEEAWRGTVHAERLPNGGVQLASLASHRPSAATASGQVAAAFDAVGRLQAVEVDGQVLTSTSSSGSGVPQSLPGAPIGLLQLNMPRAAVLKVGDRFVLQNDTPAVRGGERGHHVSQAKVLGRSMWRGRRVVVVDLDASIANPRDEKVRSFQLNGFGLIDIETGWVIHEDWWSVIRSGPISGQVGYAIERLTYSVALAP